MPRSFASPLAALASALLLGSLVPACGSSASAVNGFGKNPNGTGDDASTGDDTNNNGDDGGVHLNPNGGDSGQPNFTDAGCATATAATTKLPVYVEFILDGSGSMGQNNKWTAATGALTTIFNQMGTANDPGVAAGLIVFSDTSDKSTGKGPYPGSNDVPIAQVDATQAAALIARFTSNNDGPKSDTPTGSAMGVTGSNSPNGGGYEVVESFVPSGTLAPGGKRVLVLITDGVPKSDICVIQAGGNYTADACMTFAAQQLTAPEIAGATVETFVVGVGVFPSSNLGSFDPSFLGYLAQAGGSAPAGCNPADNTSTTGLCYFEVDPSGSATATETAFETALDAIRGQIASCTFALNATDAGAIDTSKVNVTVNGTPIFLDPTNGWSFTPGSNDSSITLNGTACDTVKNTPNSSVSIVLGCASQTPPPVK